MNNMSSISVQDVIAMDESRNVSEGVRCLVESVAAAIEQGDDKALRQTRINCARGMFAKDIMASMDRVIDASARRHDDYIR